MRLTRFCWLWSLLVFLFGLSAVASWWLDAPILRGQIDPTASVSMKWSTALCFAFMGLSHMLVRRRASAFSTIASVSLAGWAMMFMSLISWAAMTGDVSGIVSVGVTDSDRMIQTTAPGVPSAGSMACFILIGLWTIAHSLDAAHTWWNWLPRIAGYLGAIAVASHGIGFPLGFYYVEGVSSGMAVKTGVLFILLSLSARAISGRTRGGFSLPEPRRDHLPRPR